MSIPKMVQAKKSTLSTGISATETSAITLKKLVDIYSGALAMSDFGSTIFLTINPGGDNEEIISATDFTVNSDDTVTIDTGIARGLKAKSPYGSGGTPRAHAAGAIVVVSNNPQIYDAILDFMVNLEDNQTVAGVKTFSSSPVVPAPTTNLQAATKKYADDLAIAGSPDMTTTVKGITEEATETEIDADTAAGGTSARLAINPSTLATSKYGTRLPSSDQKAALAGSSGTPSSSNKFITADDVVTTVTADKVVRRDGDGHITDVNIDIQEFSTAGADTWTKPTGAKKVEVYVFGGGGGGGKSMNDAPDGWGGGGGGGGGFGYKQFNADVLGATETLAIGAGGATEVDGGDTSFGTTVLLKAHGGTKGVTAIGSNAAGGVGGVVGNGELTTAGGDGGPAHVHGISTAVLLSPRGGAGGGSTSSTPGKTGGGFTTNYVKAGGAAKTAGAATDFSLFYGGVGGGSGDGGASGTAGAAGGVPGGGGGGGGGENGVVNDGGVGADGLIIVITHR